MTEEQTKALTIVKQACAAFNGNLETHQAIQNSLQVIEKMLTEGQDGNGTAKSKKD